MEIRGIGLIDVRSMFGIHAVRQMKRIEVIVELKIWEDKNSPCERTGLSDTKESIMGVPIPHITIPVSPGKNITVISEVIAMNILMRASGEATAKAFDEKLKARIREKMKNPRSADYNWPFLDKDLTPYE